MSPTSAPFSPESAPFFARCSLRAWPLLAALALACSSSGGATPPDTVTCSAQTPCPDGLVCVIERGLCALPTPNPMDMGMPSGDMRHPPGDMGTPPDMTVPPPRGPRACPSANFCWENPLPQPRSLSAIFGTAANNVWAVGSMGVALHFDGTSWVQVPTGVTGELYGIWGRAANQIWVVGSGGTILFWDGARFTPQTSGVSETLRGIWGSSATVWAIGDRGTILKWDGTAWSAVASGVTNGLLAIWGSGENDVWAVGTSGMACHYGGTSWTCGREFTANNAYAVTGTGKNDVWVLGAMSEAWHWNGTAWTAKTRGASGTTIMAAFALSPTNIWAAGNTGTALQFNGSDWIARTVGPSGTSLNAVWGADANNVFAVGASGQILRFDGTSIKAMSSGFKAAVTAMWGTSDSDIWVFTDDKYAHHFDGAKWTSKLLPGAGYSATGTAKDDMWVGSENGRVFRYDGTNFTPVETRDAGSTIYGIYIAAADRVVLAGDGSIQFWDGARFTISHSQAGYSAWGTGPNDIWVGSTPSCAHYRFDGARWTNATIPGCAGLIASIHGTSANDVYLVSESSSLVWHWDGTQFSGVSTPSSYGKTAVFATPARVFLTTATGEVLTGVGGTFTQVLDVNSRLASIAGFTADRVWVGGAHGFVLSYKP